MKALFFVFLFFSSSFGSNADAQNLSHSQSPAVSEGSVAISVVTFVSAATAARYAHLQYGQAKARQTFQTSEVSHSVGIPGNASIIQEALKGTAPGDVIHLEYTVTRPGALKVAVTELEKSSVIWEARVQSLILLREELAGKMTRNLALQNELENLTAVLADAQGRWKTVRQSYMRAKPALVNFEKYRSLFNRKIKIQRDVLIDKETPVQLQSLFESYAKRFSTPQTQASFSDFTITRVQIPNESLSARAMMRARGGMVAVVFMASVISEELVTGVLGRHLEYDLRGHYAPNVQTSPDASAP